VNHLDVAITNDREAANFTVTLVAGRHLTRTIRSLYGNDRAKQIQKSLNPQCLSGIGKDSHYRIRRAEVVLPVDAGEFVFYDCAYEELLQALGAINDDRSVPWTMFNDDVQMGFFDVYDQYLLNILYDPRVRPGMTKEEVNGLLPDLLSTARAWVTGAKLPRHADARHQLVQGDQRPRSSRIRRLAEYSRDACAISYLAAFSSRAPVFTPRQLSLENVLKRDEIKLNRHRALASCLSMIFSENRFTLFRIML
jgi:hypothetical protein